MLTPKFNFWQCKALYVLSPLSLSKLAQQANIDPKVLADTASIENWERLKTRYQGLSESDQKDLHIIDLLLDTDDPSKKQFVKDVLAKIESAKKRNTKDAVKTRYASQLSEFGMSQKEAQRLLDEYDTAVSGAPNDDYSINSDLSEREQLDIINAGYAMLSRGLNSSLYTRLQGLERAIDFWQRMIDDMHKSYLIWSSTATFDDMSAKCRTMSYAAQSLAKLLDSYMALTGIDKYVDVQSSMAKLRAMGYHTLHESQLQELAKK